ncbi:hypothetical protein T484DRAFT_1798342 [Baffinella frigidus]|nr:hypothetical protein T484DRAFT_1798342 [Cryptophyta sp. CCMP2293]
MSAAASSAGTAPPSGEAPPRAKEKRRSGAGCWSFSPGPSGNHGDGRRTRTEAVRREKPDTVVATLGYRPANSRGDSQSSLPSVQDSAPPPQNAPVPPAAEAIVRRVPAPNAPIPPQEDGADERPQTPSRDAPPPDGAPERTPARQPRLGGTLAYSLVGPAATKEESGAEVDWDEWDEIPDMVVVAGAPGGEAKGLRGAVAEDYSDPFSPTIDGLQDLDVDDDPPSHPHAASARAAAGVAGATAGARQAGDAPAAMGARSPQKAQPGHRLPPRSRGATPDTDTAAWMAEVPLSSLTLPGIAKCTH